MGKEKFKKKEKTEVQSIDKIKKRDLYSHTEVEKMNMAYHLILRSFPKQFRNTYLRGKTEFRDFLYEKMGCSLLEAEIVVDALEKNGKIEFRRFRKGMRYGEW